MLNTDEGCIRFAMEMMKLKPSFARKLNQQYLSPLHLAVRKGHRRMVLHFLEIDKDLIHAKGKNGNTPLHIISEVGNNNGLLDRFLKICPQSIRAVTIKNRNALHIVVENDRPDVLQVLIQTLRKTDYYCEVMNQKGEDGNTALYLDAFHNQTEADKHSTNQAGWMALDIAKRYNNNDRITVLRGCFIPGVSNFNCEDRNALLVILGLLLTVTYQASLSPPGGVWQGDNTSKSKGSDDSTIIGNQTALQLLLAMCLYHDVVS
ncbi:hypothetical protein Godav_024135 [Gossypium davidsonii]|uniref:PGG domain-containing protein n=1 Tax=Gossypium davidsonii TaxID=34287 RepID=A0A7J8SVM5_GOSDV|nr:hypothetical protein [Gossypium davidsonii]